MTKIKIATAQPIVHKSVRENGLEIRTLITEGHKQGASIIHFCEGALSGYAKQQLTHYKDLDFISIKKEMAQIQALCKKLGVWAVIGGAHQLANDTKPHNSLYIISDKGKIANRYDKRKCSHNELKDWYTPGFDACTFEVSGYKFSCAICIEIQFPEIFIQAEKEDVDCMLFSTYSKEPMFGIQAQGYAATNNYWISMSVPQNVSALKGSQFIGPNGVIVAECTNNESAIIVSEINKEDDRWHVPLKLAKPWRRLAREGTIYREKKTKDKRSQIKDRI